MTTQMKVAHTPGPWMFDEETQTVRVREWERNQFMGDFRGCIIASFEQSHGGPHREESLDLRPEIEANARLIAAAPRMHDKLVELYEWLDDIGDGAPDASPTQKRALNQAAEIRDILEAI